MTQAARLSLAIRSRRAASAAAFAAAVVVGGLVWSRFHGHVTVRVTTRAVTTGPIVRHIVATGTLQPLTTIEVGAQVSGAVESLGADYNSIVHAGQVIARLDPALFRAALGGAQAILEEAQAALLTAQADKTGAETAVDDARTKLRRAEELGAQQLLPQADLDAARVAMGEALASLQSATSQVRVTEAGVAQAGAVLDQAKVNLDHTIITAPIDGIVTSRNVDVGQTVAAAVQAPVLFDIAADVRRMQLEVDIDEADIAGIHRGEPVTFQVESYPDRTFAGTVSSIRLQPVIDQTTATAGSTTLSPAASPTAAPLSTSSGAAPTIAGTLVTYATMVDVANADEQLRPGMTATVALAGAERAAALRVPSNALLFRPPIEVLTAIGESADVLSTIAIAADTMLRRVWRYDGARFTPVDVRVGLADADWTEVVSGQLHAGEAVVTGAVLARDR